MPLTDHLIQFTEGPVMIHLGVRDANFQPHVAAIWGMKASPTELRIFLLDVHAERLMPHLEANGQMAVVVSSPLSSETYQFKGTFVGAQPGSEADYAIHRIYWEKMGGFFQFLHSSGHVGVLDAIARMRLEPFVTVTMRVDEVFDQTPGPGTGQPVAVN